MKRSQATTISEGLGSTIRKITLKASDYQTWTAMEIGSLLADPGKGADLQKVSKLLPIFEDNKIIEQILNYSTNEEAVQKIIERVQCYMSIAESALLLTTVEVCVSYFREKFKVGDELHVSLLRFSDKFIPVAPGNLPYENNKGTVKSMGRTLVENIYWHKFGTIRNQTLLVNSDYFGSGKTRLGIEFLKEWKQQLKDNPQEKDWLSKTYSEECVSQLEKSQMVYVDCRSIRIIENSLERTLANLVKQIEYYVGGKLSTTPCFIVLDEIGYLIASYKPEEAKNYKHHYHFTSMNLFLLNFFLPLQKIPTISLYVCGKGAFLEILGNGKLSTDLVSPTLISKISVTPLAPTNIRNILESSSFTELVSKLKKLDLFEFYLEKLFEETKGIPFFVDYYQIKSRKFDFATKTEITDMFDEIGSEIPQSFSSPFTQFVNSPTTLGAYKSLLCAGLLSLPINHSKFSLEFVLDFTNTEFEGLSNLTYIDVASMLNCYLLQQIPGTKNFLLLFPKPIIKAMFQSDLCYSIPILGPIVQQYKEILSKGDIFEYLMGIILSFRLKWGSLQSLTIGDVLPFLKETLIGPISCGPINIVNLKTKLLSSKPNLIRGYKTVLKTLKTGDIGVFYDASHSPDHLWRVQENTFVGIHDKNKFSFTELEKEIKKIEKLRIGISARKQEFSNDAEMESFTGKDDDAILLILVFYRCSIVGLEKNVFTKAIDIKGEETITLAENTSVVIVDGDTTRSFLGNENLEALTLLSNFISN